MPRHDSRDTSSKPRRWFTRNWAGLRPQYAQRLAKYLTDLRVDAGETQRDLAAAADVDGEKLSQPTINNIERLRVTIPQGEDIKHGPHFLPVMWSLYHSGRRLSDLEDYLLSGDERMLAPSEASRAQDIRAAFLALSEPRRRELETIVDMLMQMDAREQAATPTATTASSTADPEEDESSRERLLRGIALTTTDDQLGQWQDEGREQRKHKTRRIERNGA